MPDEQRRRADDDLARVRVELATAAADATPLSELEPTARDLTRVQPLLDQLLHVVADLLGTDMAAVWVTDPLVDEVFPAAWMGLPDEYIGPLRVAFGSGSAGRAVAERAPVVLTDIGNDPAYAAFSDEATAHGITSVLSMPMLTLTGEPMGALTAYYRETTEPGERERGLVEAYARQAAEIVERARLHAEARQLAELEQRRARQLRGLAEAALALSAAESLDDLLRIVTDAARDIIGVHQGVTSRLPQGWTDATTYVSLSEDYAQWREFDTVPKGLGVLNYVTRENKPLRLTGEELVRHPEWRGLRDAPGHPPMPDYLAAPLIGRTGVNLGLVQLSHKTDGSAFSEEDEVILVQLAQMASSAVEGLEALERERTARRQAETAAAAQATLSEASARFAEVLEPAEVTRLLADVSIPRLAALAVVYLLDDAGQPVLAEARTLDPTRRSRLVAYLEAFPPEPGQPHGVGRVLATGRPELVPEVTDELLASVTSGPAAAAQLREVTLRSGLCVPLTARGRLLGVLALSRDEPYTQVDIDYALDLGRRAALALDNATRYAFERDLAGALQRSLLPRSTPTSALLTTASRYLAGARGTQVGGDWYDVIEVDDGKLVLVVGDVMGRGVQAAAVMGQLRATVRAYAVEGHGPVQLLRRLDRIVQSLDDVNFTTCVVGLLDPATRELCVALAGHLPPLIIGPDGTAAFLDAEPGLPLGVGGGDFTEQSVQLAPGTTVLLYTDGLVEGRDLPVEEGMRRLREAAARPVRSVEELCDRVLTALGHGGDHDDDTALLALLLDDGIGPRGREPLVLELPATGQSAAVARAALAELLGPDLGDAADTAGLLVSELVSNAVRFAGGDLLVRAGIHSNLLLVEVCDTSERRPTRVAASDDAESGRGLQLLTALADRWGSDPLPTGKRVWFELSLDG